VFGIIKAKLTVTAEQQRWIDESFVRLAALVGSGRLLQATVVLPTPEHFPDVYDRWVMHPEKCYLQYLGIRVGKRNLIYVNASDEWNAIHADPILAHWHDTPIIGCDGGDSFWGAVYDPAAEIFSDLEINLPLL
jgi:hypothetical protein